MGIILRELFAWFYFFLQTSTAFKNMTPGFKTDGSRRRQKNSQVQAIRQRNPQYPPAGVLISAHLNQL